MNYLKRYILAFTLLPFLLFAKTIPSLDDIDIDTHCVKELGSFDMDYEHVMIIVDRTTQLAEEQIEWLGDTIFTKRFAEEFPPFTKFSLIFVDDQNVQMKDLAYSKCRPKTGKNNTEFEIDKYGSDENERMVKLRYDDFINGYKVGNKNMIGFEDLKTIIGISSDSKNTFLLETIINVLRTKALDFGSKRYKKRTLIIASDLMQYSSDDKEGIKRVDYYSACKNKSISVSKHTCPTFEKFLEKNKTIKEYIDTTKPRDLDGLNIEIKYLNFGHQKNRKIDTSLIELWRGYFEYIGLDMPDDVQDWVERQLDLAS
jgi:hypothetical protein|tara:strand:- start:1161 stop:2102 length:942 start_codon:yes stop_codon:yes gene_type:complete